jgi:hypothetical protein
MEKSWGILQVPARITIKEPKISGKDFIGWRGNHMDVLMEIPQTRVKRNSGRHLFWEFSPMFKKIHSILPRKLGELNNTIGRF